MKKIFTLVAAVLAIVSLSATVYTPDPVQDTIKAIFDKGLVDGDTIVLTDGTYYEWSSMTFDSKVTFIAAPGTKPELHWYSIKIKNDFEVNGINMVNISKDNYLLRTGGDVPGKITIKNCSFTLNEAVTSPATFIYLSSNSVGELEIDNCVFNANAKSEQAIMQAGSATIESFSMTNCTANGAGAGGDLAVRCENVSKILVDHCTFYNCGQRPIYLKGSVMTSYLVQNCIFSAPEVISKYCVATYAGDVMNCVYYNYNGPRSDDAAITSCVNADPLFVDPAKGDFNFAFTSPLFLGGTDGKHIGDPRWTVEAGEAVAIPATLPNDKAALAGPKIALTEDGIAWNDQSDPTLNSASWTVEVNNAVQLDVVLNVSSKSTSGHQCAVALYCTDSLIASVSEAAQSSTTGEIKLGTFDFPAAGKYMVRLTNATKWSSAIVESLSFTDHATGVSVLKAKQTSKKIMVNGQMVIVREGEQYNVLGTKF